MRDRRLEGLTFQEIVDEVHRLLAAGNTRAAVQILRGVVAGDGPYARRANALLEQILAERTAAAPATAAPRAEEAARPRRWKGSKRKAGSRAKGSAKSSTKRSTKRSGAPPKRSAPPTRRLRGTSGNAESARTVTTPAREVRRTPHMDILPEIVRPGTQFSVFVYADIGGRRAGEESETIEMTFPPDVVELAISTRLAVSDHFQVVGEPIHDIVISRDIVRSTSAQFTVRARPLDESPGLAATPSIGAYFSFGGRPCGMVSRTVRIAGPRKKKDPVAPKAKRVEGRRPTVVVSTGEQPPDLTVEIIDENRNGRHFACTVRSPHLPGFRNGRAGRWDLPKTADALVADYFRNFTADHPSSEQTMFMLRGAGLQLFEAAPDLFREVFWSLVDQKLPLRSILVVTQEAFVPWELMVPTRARPGKPREDWDRPIGVDYAVGRWIKETFVSPSQRISLTDALSIAPVYPGKRGLKHAQAEIAQLGKHFPLRPIAPATVANIKKGFTRGGASVIHFACHGSADPEEVGSMEILLDGAKEQLDSVTLRGMPAAKTAIEQRRSFVFMNACEVGRTKIAINGVGGLPPTFLMLGASAVIAPLWSVKDDIAFEVAKIFYERAKGSSGDAFADIVRQIRRRSYEEPYEDSWAAYAFYGDPLAVRATD